jgi:hypothetical protein
MNTQEFADAISEAGIKQGRYRMVRELADWIEKESDGMKLDMISTDRLLAFLKKATL